MVFSRDFGAEEQESRLKTRKLHSKYGKRDRKAFITYSRV